jgi:hypothetical protein
MATQYGRTSVSRSVAFLVDNRADLEGFEDVEDFVFSSGPVPQHHRAGFEHHLTVVRQSLARVLWSHGIFIGVSVLDSVLFHAVAHTPAESPVEWVIGYIRSQGLHGSGLVVHPLHSFGILGAGLFRWATRTQVHFISEAFGFGVTPQTNDWARSCDFMDTARAAFGISRTIPRELLEHWSRSRPIRWLTQNPLLIVKTRSFPGEYFENQSLLVLQLQFATSVCFMLASLQPGGIDTRREAKAFSSSMVNNFQTLDLRHYLVFYGRGRRRQFSGQCVPIHARRGTLAELSDLAVEIDPRYWRGQRRAAAEIYAAVSTIQRGFLKFSIGRIPETVESRVYKKIFDALVFFRRSFRRSDRVDESCVNLAIAFETLLTDHFERGREAIPERLEGRVGKAIGGRRERRTMISAVSRLYEARSRVVHQGRRDVSADLDVCQRAFTLSLVGLARRLRFLSRVGNASPIGDLLDRD